LKKIKDLPEGRYRVTLNLRNQGELRVRGEIIEDRGGNRHLHTQNSPKRSFAPNTNVSWFREEV